MPLAVESGSSAQAAYISCLASPEHLAVALPIGARSQRKWFCILGSKHCNHIIEWFELKLFCASNAADQ